MTAEESDNQTEMEDTCECTSAKHGGSCGNPSTFTIKGLCWTCVAFCWGKDTPI